MRFLDGLITCVVLAVTVFVLAATAGCGGGDSEATLNADQAVVVAGFNADVAFVNLDGSSYGDLLDSMDEVIALARENPDAIYEGTDGKVTMRQVLSDAASTLQPSQPDLAAQLDRAVETLE